LHVLLLCVLLLMSDPRSSRNTVAYDPAK